MSGLVRDGLLRDGLLVGLGGFFGAAARFLVTGWLQARDDSFPYGTLAVNVAGSLALAFLATMLSQRAGPGSAFRLITMVGFLGAFTTFSAFSYESALLWSSGRWAALAGNVVLNVGACLLATAAGIALARQLAGGP